MKPCIKKYTCTGWARTSNPLTNKRTTISRKRVPVIAFSFLNVPRRLGQAEHPPSLADHRSAGLLRRIGLVVAFGLAVTAVVVADLTLPQSTEPEPCLDHPLHADEVLSRRGELEFCRE